ncbi:MAG: D-aminoacyl-tRNA deacylase [Mariniphaga sp.]
MRIVIQRVSEASVSINNGLKSSIRQGLLILAGFESDDNQEDLEWTIKKIIQLRIFDDQNGVMNLSVKDIDGEILAVSQFTLHAKTKKGNRPSYINAATSEIAIPLYQCFVQILSDNLGKPVQTGEFGAMMMVQLINDGPVTIIIDSKNKDL